MRKRLQSLIKLLPKSQGRAVPIENLHITLNFLGNVAVDRIPEFIKQAESCVCPPFELSLDGLGYFAKTRMLWVGCNQIHERLLMLVASLNKCLRPLGCRPERRAYVPHVTLVRNARPLKTTIEFEPISWPTNDFVLVRSVPQQTGSIYRVLQEFHYE